MADLYRRTLVAQTMARQLLRPSALDVGLRSGLFLSGIRRTGKTTFLRQDLIPVLEEAGAIVIYVDLWADTHANPAMLVHTAIARALAELQQPASAVLQRLRRIKAVDVGGAGFKFGFQLDAVGVAGGVTLADALTQLVDQARTDVVLVIDEVQQALASEDGHRMLLAIKAARDAINPRSDTPGHFLFIGTGSHRAMVGEMTARKNQAFAGATSVPFPVLDEDYLDFLLQGLAQDGVRVLPSPGVAWQAFQTLGHRPEEMLRALRQLQGIEEGSDPDRFLPVIAATLRGAAADVELAKVEALGSLAMAIFERIALAQGQARGLFSGEAMADYGRIIGRDATADQVQRVTEDMMDANLIMRRGHGVYDVADPFVAQVWLQRRALGGLASAEPSA